MTAGDFRFTDHAIVRLIERHVDEAGVLALRRRGACEREMATYLRISHASAIGRLERRVRAMLDRRTSQFLNVMCGITFTIVLGRVPLVIAGDNCVTVLPRRDEGRGRAA